MGCREAFSCLCTFTTTTMTSSSLKHEQFFKPNIIFCCINGPNGSTLSSSSSDSVTDRRYNPIGRTRFDKPPPEIVRRWIEADSVPPSQERVTIVSYNILGDKNASKHRDLYPNVPSIYMKWHHRKRVICEELIGWNPDIICLQEVDKYFDLFTIMEKAGYSGTYKRRTGDAVDGCAMLWKADKFRLLEGENIEFKRYDLRDNVAQICVLEMSENCQLCRILGHTAQTCPSLHNRCNIPNCDGVMIRHNCDGRMFFKCHRDTCPGYFLCVEVADSHVVDTLTPCQVCGLNGHRPYECPSSMPSHGASVDTNELPHLQIQEDDEPTQYTLDEDPHISQVCQICYDLGHNARTCTWLQQRCFTPNCDGPWIFFDLGADQPLEAYNRECTGYKHIGMVTHDEINSPIESLSCQLCGAYGHAVYQCSDLLSLYPQNDERDSLFCELCGLHGHDLQACPDVLAVRSELEEDHDL